MVKSFPGTLKEGGGRGEYSHDFLQFHLLAQTFIILFNRHTEQRRNARQRNLCTANMIFVNTTLPATPKPALFTSSPGGGVKDR